MFSFGDDSTSSEFPSSNTYVTNVLNNAHPNRAITTLTDMHQYDIFIHRRTTVNIDDHLLEKAAKLTGIKEKSSLVRLGLEARISKNAALRLANLGGSEKQLQLPPRR